MRTTFGRFLFATYSSTEGGRYVLPSPGKELTLAGGRLVCWLVGWLAGWLAGWLGWQGRFRVGLEVLRS